MLTAKQFAAETDISYPIIIRWLKEEKIPGAVLTDFKVWQIPSTQVVRFLKPENRPKAGWKKGRKRKNENGEAKPAKKGARAK
jgi:predicted site-specific integrase-resolvase